MGGDSQTPRRKTSDLAARQHGHVTRRQLLGLGVPATTIDAWVRDGELLRVHQGVYAVGYRRVEPVARAMAAVLACGPTAALSHDSALALWGLRRWPTTPEVTVTIDRRRPRIVIHHSTTLRRHDRSVWLGVRATRPARAIADMGRRLTDAQRTRLVNDARLRDQLTVGEQRALLGHVRNATRSGGEDALQRWITRHHLPQPLINARVNGHEVDALWPDAKVILELDHPATHGDPVTFASDRRHDREDSALGYVTVRLVEQDLSAAEAGRLRRLLHGRSPGPGGC